MKSMKAVRRAHILLPQELVGEIDEIVGSRKRSAFLVETARAEIRRRKLLHFLESDEPAWKDKDHPELAKGPAAWVRNLRQEGQTRSAAIELHARQPNPRAGKKK
ncbi:MAG: hypothetical protein ACYDBH_06070 [Acidobacteriaceae bacterium]